MERMPSGLCERTMPRIRSAWWRWAVHARFTAMEVLAMRAGSFGRHEFGDGPGAAQIPGGTASPVNPLALF